MGARVSQIVMRKMRAYAIKQAVSEIKDIDDKPAVEHIAKRHGLGYGELKQAYAKEQKHETTQ